MTATSAESHEVRGRKLTLLLPAACGVLAVLVMAVSARLWRFALRWAAFFLPLVIFTVKSPPRVVLPGPTAGIPWVACPRIRPSATGQSGPSQRVTARASRVHLKQQT
jgi:hypothetical protein